jgi:hypothetical protein
LSKKDRIPNQRIERIVVSRDSVEFQWNRDGVHNIIAPTLCIKELIDEIDKGKREGSIEWQEAAPLKIQNYTGAKLREERIELNYYYGKETKVEIVSVRSLYRIKGIVNSYLSS